MKRVRACAEARMIGSHDVGEGCGWLRREERPGAAGDADAFRSIMSRGTINGFSRQVSYCLSGCCPVGIIEVFFLFLVCLFGRDLHVWPRTIDGCYGRRLSMCSLVALGSFVKCYGMPTLPVTGAVSLRAEGNKRPVMPQTCVFVVLPQCGQLKG